MPAGNSSAGILVTVRVRVWMRPNTSSTKNRAPGFRVSDPRALFMGRKSQRGVQRPSGLDWVCNNEAYNTSGLAIDGLLFFSPMPRHLGGSKVKIAPVHSAFGHRPGALRLFAKNVCMLIEIQSRNWAVGLQRQNGVNRDNSRS
jgi:hypothetical protein